MLYLRPEPSPATTKFHEQFPPRGHQPPAWLYPVPYGCAALYTFSIFFNPRGGAPHKESQPLDILREHAHVHAQAERTHKARISFLRFDSHATHACTLQPAALVFVSYGFVLVASSSSSIAHLASPFIMYLRQIFGALIIGLITALSHCYRAHTYHGPFASRPCQAANTPL